MDVKPAAEGLLLGAGLLAGIVGSAGGTASLISYPALLAAGLAPLPANITNAVAFVAAWPGSSLGSRPELRGQGRQLLRWAPLAVVGSAAGAALLLVTPQSVFDQVVPFLLGVADVTCCILFIAFWPVNWAAVLPLAAGFLIGSAIGPALTRRLPAQVVRIIAALAGLGLAIRLWWTGP